MLDPLPYAEWEPTKVTLQLWLQIVGKIRLRAMPPRNHWWHVTLYATERGLSTMMMPHRDRFFEIAFDFVDHRLTIGTSRGDARSFPLRAWLRA